jgi:phage repressor protein C with HTH and peptisase S24 domain
MPETLADRIQQRLDALGLSERAASLAATGSDATIRMIRTGKSVHPRADTLSKLAQVLQTTEQWLLNGGEVATVGADPALQPSDVREAQVPVPTTLNLPKDMPVLGTAAGSELGQGAFQITTDVVDYVRRPPGLIGARDAYSLYVEGDSMSPRFEPGDLIFVHPHRKPLGGDYVVIQEPDTNNGEPRAFVKRLVKITGTTIRVQQFNPPATIDFIIRPGTRVHKVLTDVDLYGT